MRGWLLDVYASEQEGEGAVVWLLGEDGRRYRLHQPFPVAFYATGPASRLRQAWRFLRRHPLHPGLRRDSRRELFAAQPIEVLVVELDRPADQQPLFHQLAGEFPDLAYYDADLLLPLRFAARCGAFPLAHCEFEAGPGGALLSLQPLDSPWDIDPEPPPLRVLRIGPDVDPGYRPPTAVHLRCERSSYCLPLQPERPLLVNLRAILNRHDPDLLLSAWGDTWLLPYLIELSQKLELPLPLNRDPGQEIVFRPEQSYFSYGQIIYHGRQVYLSGRWHLDTRNASFFDDYGLHGILELARVTCLPVQTAARVSPGTGISAMQVLTALRLGVLVPWHKQRAEDPKSALDMIRSDQGGMVYQPVIGLHHDVAELDFISMYPSIMVNFNISPETVHSTASTLDTAPDLEAIADRTRPGLVPQTLAPLLEKRIAYKTRQAELPAWDPRRKRYKACSSAHKWLLVTCFGYLGYKNARFGRIEAHEAVTAYGREALLRAKDAAEEMGYTVLHMYVDGLWVYRPGACDPASLRPLLDEIARRTGLSIALEGIYRWLAFLGSRLDARVPVANRYFGVFQDGSVKMRGIEARRHDTPLYVAETQVALIELLGKLGWPAGRQAAFALVRRRIAALRFGRVPLEKLLVKQRLSRELCEYRSPSPAARAAAQLSGRELRPGQSVPFIFIRGDPGVYAWGSLDPLNPDCVDVSHYVELLLRAAVTVFEPFGPGEEEIRARLTGGGVAQPLPLPLPAGKKVKRLLPGGRS